MKKAIIFGLIIVAVVAAIVTTVVLTGGEGKDSNKNLITISFFTDGGSSVEDLKVEKGTEVDLPVTSKEGYTFLGWFDGESEVKSDTVFEKDMKLVAKWEKIPEEAKTMEISFDAKGGTKTNSIKVECDKELPMLPTPTRNGYRFVSWADKNGKVILKGALLSCENVTLYANWEIKETPSAKTFTVTYDSKGGSAVKNSVVSCGATLKLPANPTREGYTFVSWADKNGTVIHNDAKLSCENITLYANWEYDGPAANPDQGNEPYTPPTPQKTYKCESGFELKDGNRCVKLATPEKYCQSGWKEVNGECVNPSSPNPKGTRTCPSKTYNGWTGTGTYYEAGRGYCGYYELTSYIGQSQNCKNAGGTLAANNHCYKYIEISYTVTCANDEKLFAAQIIAPGNGGGCYQVKPMSKKCPDGYTNASVWGECALVKDAIYE